MVQQTTNWQVLTGMLSQILQIMHALVPEFISLLIVDTIYLGFFFTSLVYLHNEVGNTEYIARGKKKCK